MTVIPLMLVEADGACVVIDNAQDHTVRLLVLSSTLGCRDKARPESMTPLVPTHRQVAELPLSWFGGFGHLVIVGKSGYRGDDVVAISEYECLTQSRCDVAQGFDIGTLGWQVTTVDVGPDREVRNYRCFLEFRFTQREAGKITAS